MSRYKRENVIFKDSLARRIPPRTRPKPSLAAVMLYWIVANAVKVYAIAGKIVGER